VGIEQSAVFASDNTAPAHPKAISAIAAANEGAVGSYGEDPHTARATALLRDTFDSPDAEVIFAFTGTAANTIAVSAAVRPWHEILCSDIAHILVDEAGGPVRLSGAQLTRLPSEDGIISTTELDRRIVRRGDVHHSQPHIVSITQSTENGRVWSAAEINAFVDHAHSLGLLVHVDGARLANAIAALDITPGAAIGDADIVTVGGTKNGMLFGDAILVRRPELFDGIRFTHKQIGHLASKQRYITAQFAAFFADDTWLHTAAHANAMAGALSRGLTEQGYALAVPTDANEVFVDLDTATYTALSADYLVHKPDPLTDTVRFVCSWATTEQDVQTVLAVLRRIAGR